MKKGLTEMVFILDMSGSMQYLAQDTIGGYNSLINQQRKEDGDANITTVLFDDRYIVLHNGENIQSVPEITSNDYCPFGSTAMLDAIGKTINSVGQRLAKMPEEERPEKVIVTIITDGKENSSKEFTWKSVKEMIEHQRTKYSWVFTFIGANIDTMEVSDNLGIDAKLSKTYTANQVGTQSVYCAMSKAVSFTRGVDAQSLCSVATTDCMSDIMDEVE